MSDVIDENLQTIPCHKSDLPVHILQSIFCKLPITTLLDCRYVCKSWLHILSDPNFTKLLLSAREPSGLLICVKYRVEDEYLLWLLECQGESRNFHFAAKPRWTYDGSTAIDFVNSCNGLFLFWFWPEELENVFTMRVMNPVTGEYIEFPVPYLYPLLSNPATNEMYSSPDLCGLGYVSSTNQFKVVRIYFSYGRRIRDKTVMAEVCILGSGTWRTIGQIPSSYDSMESCNAFVNGSCHWLLSGDDHSEIPENSKVCAFDFETERFRSMCLPVHRHGSDHVFCYVTSIGVFRGSLSFSCRYVSSGCDFSDVWIMKEYGEENSWFKFFVMEHNPIDTPYRSWVFRAINVLENGLILVLYDKALFLYNPETKAYTKLDIQGTQSGIKQAFVHMTPNFASLKDIVGKTNLKVLKVS